MPGTTFVSGTDYWSKQMNDKFDFVSSYRAHAERLVKATGSAESAMQQGVGGNFDAIGVIERELLIQHGLRPQDYLIDVGCGSGRLAQQLPSYLTGRYLGIDVVPEFVAHAQRLANRADWRFEVSDGIRIPEHDDQTDMICFFSVLTHLTHEQSYCYLAEAKRVLRPGGRIMFSFLEFRIPDQWQIFESLLGQAYEDHPLVMFFDRDAIRAWSQHLGLEIERLIDGNVPHVPIPHPLTFDGGTVVHSMAKLGPIGQSVCVLRKPD